MATTTTDNYGFPSNAPTIGESVSDAAEWLKKHRASLVEALLLESTRRNGECLLTEPEAMALTAKLNSVTQPMNSACKRCVVVLQIYVDLHVGLHFKVSLKRFEVGVTL
jgi:hypothetical protein